MNYYRLYYCFLIYSILPGVSKILNINIIFAFNLPILIFLIYKVKLKRKYIILITFFLSYLILQTLQAFNTNNSFNFNSFYESFYVWIIPMVGLLFCRKYFYLDILWAIMNVAVVHGIIGILTYGLIPYPSVIQSSIDAVQDGVAAFRMASVSGSLIFGVIVSSGFNIALYLLIVGNTDERKSNLHIKIVVLFLATLLSLQRSAWLAILLPTILFMLYNFKYFKKSLMLFFPLFVVVIITLLNNEFYYERFLSLFSSDFNPVDERMKIWMNGFSYLNDNIFGQGLGQVGQFAYKNNLNIPFFITDGDYVKIVAEGGAGLGFLYLLIIFVACIRALRLNNKVLIKSDIFIFLVLIGFLIQMLGSNISEFYYVNFIFWVVLGVTLFRVDRK